MANINVHAIGENEANAFISGEEDCPILKIKVGSDEVSIFLHEGKAENFLRALREAICDALEEMGEEPPRHMPPPPEEEFQSYPPVTPARIVPCLYCNGRGNQVYHDGLGFRHDLCQTCSGKGSVCA